MYAGFVFFFLAASYAIWAWAERGKARDLLLAVLLSAAAISFHRLGQLLAVVAVIPLAFAGWSRARPLGLLALAGFAAVSARAYQELTTAHYKFWPIPPGPTGQTFVSRQWLPESITGLPEWAGLLAIFGAALGVWAAHRTHSPDSTPGGSLRKLGSYLVAGVAGAAACTGQLYAAALALLVLLLFHPAERMTLARRTWLPGSLAAAIALSWAGASVVRLGPVDGVKALISYPFPFLATLGLSLPGVVLFFLGACAWLALRTPRPEENALRGCAIAGLVIIAAVGFRRG